MATPRNPYQPHPGLAMVARWKASLKPKTGKSLDEWVSLVRKAAPGRQHMEITNWLKAEHGLPTNSAWQIAERALGGGEDDSPEAYLRAAPRYVDEMFSGPRAGLRPIYERLLALCLALGDEVKVSPGKTIVPIYRRHVVAQIKPAANGRLDFGLALGEVKRPPKRLVDTRGLAKKDRITCRFELARATDVDAEVARWLKKAWELDA